MVQSPPTPKIDWYLDLMTKNLIIINKRYRLKLYNRSQVRPLHTHLMKTNIVHLAYKKQKKKSSSKHKTTTRFEIENELEKNYSN